VIGVSLTSAPLDAPMELRASRTALAIAATAPPSPIPFMPYSVCGVGVWRWPILIAGSFGGAGQEVIGQGAGERLASFVVGDLFEEGGADALHDVAADLAFDEHRVDHRAAILGDGVIEQLDKAGLGVDGDDCAVRCIGLDAGADRRFVGRGRVEQRNDALRQSVHPQMRDLGDLGDRDRSLWPRHQAIGTAHLGDIALQQVRADAAELVAQHAAGARRRAARHPMLREAKVPNPKAVLSVSPWRTEIRAGSMPSSSAATCDSAVSRPWPCDWMPTISTTLPSVRMRAVQLSKPGMIEAPPLAPKMGAHYLFLMRIISRRTLREFVGSRAGHSDQQALKAALDAWFDEVRKAKWSNTADVKRLYASASIVSSDRIVFNIRGNAYRLVVVVDFEKAIVWIKWLGTHRDYDRIDVREVNHE